MVVWFALGMLNYVNRLEDVQICNMTGKEVQVDTPGRFGSVSSIAEALPTVTELNGLSRSKCLGGENEEPKNSRRPRLPRFSKEDPLTERVMSAMWQYILTYRLADEEKLDETPIW